MNLLKNNNFGSSYNKFVNSFFTNMLKRDVAAKSKYKGYPSYWTMKFAQWSRSSGIKFVDEKKGDFTLGPLIKQYSYLIGGQKSLAYKLLMTANMKLFGGFLDITRIDSQIKFFESYNEYAQDFKIMTILDNILSKQISLYFRKILEEFKYSADREGTTLKSFVIDNKEFFKEIEIYFQFKDKAELDCLTDALEELKSRRQAKVRDYFMKGNIANAIFNMVIMTIAFGKTIIPQITSNFESTVEEFSPVIQFVNSLSIFLTNRWYLAILVSIGLYALTKTHTARLITGSLAFKIPLAKEYVVNDQILRFFKSYVNLIESDNIRNSYIQSLKMVDNEYLHFILSTHTEEIGETGVTFYKILEEIPYIPKEYIDVVKEAEIMGKPEDGIKKVIKIAEPKMDKLVKTMNKNIFWAVMLITTLISILLAMILFKDMNSMINTYNEEFIDRLRN